MASLGRASLLRPRRERERQGVQPYERTVSVSAREMCAYSSLVSLSLDIAAPVRRACVCEASRVMSEHRSTVSLQKSGRTSDPAHAKPHQDQALHETAACFKDEGRPRICRRHRRRQRTSARRHEFICVLQSLTGACSASSAGLHLGSADHQDPPAEWWLVLLLPRPPRNGAPLRHCHVREREQR